MALLSVPILAGALLAAVVIHNLLRVYTSPLSKIPNAGFGAAYSRLAWAFPQEYKGTVTIDLPKLHEKLGPLVRIGPNEVSFYSRETYETVHKVGSKFRKDPRVYGEFVQGGHPALFSITQVHLVWYLIHRLTLDSDPEQHAKRRRIMGQLFSRTKVPQLEKLISSHVNRFVQLIRDNGPNVDLAVASRALEADIMSTFSFGKSIEAIDSWASGKELEMVAKNDLKATWMPVLTNFPLLCELLEQLEDVIFRVTGVRSAYTKGLTEFQQSALSEDSELDEPATKSPNLIKSLCNSENLGPGTDTTSATLAHILWALAQNPDYQKALYEDLAAISFSTDMTTLESVPRLQACVKEGIRWAGAAAAMLPRIVPSGGIELHGKFIPGGTVLTSSPIWYQHDKTAFPNPQVYNPYRWLTDDCRRMSEDKLRDRFYIPFSRGANICMGAHFAYLELYISVSQVIRSFHLEICNSAQRSTLGKDEETNWTPVPLPKRREWVAAVPTEKLEVKMLPRL
ncbi:hypothetical protein LCI18_015098 [Fusarium solani-melongenae]|uniref:Uncharacterized protein n=1 Tax=Fusarium solani subsp. cucurbitae TaxID=2747967 RepID=A0ACD3ZTR1_FUSSC|nr:hypothetical protein LCI18_015098 [Fusarium solani-melongenae]